MDFVVIALIIVAVWIGLLVLVLAVCSASGRADAAEEREGHRKLRNKAPEKKQKENKKHTTKDTKVTRRRCAGSIYEERKS